MFYGQWEYKSDNKRRVFIPKMFRSKFCKQAIIEITSSNSSSVYPFNEAVWKNLPAENKRKVRIDSFGRITLPKPFGVYAKFVWIGKEKYFEIKPVVVLAVK